MIITRAPLRISLVGGGTDYPDFFSKHGGLCVGFATNLYSYIQLRCLPPYHEYKSRFVYSEIEKVIEHSGVKHRLIREALLLLKIDQGVELFHSCDLPSGTGTGSSSTFAVSLLTALHALSGRLPCPEELAEQAIKLERVVLGETGGLQDQYWAALGGVRSMRFHRDSSLSSFPLPLSREKLDELEGHLLFAYTGRRRVSGEVAARALACPTRERKNLAILQAAENGLQALQNGDLRRLAHLIDLSWRAKAELAVDPDTSHACKLIAEAKVKGAWGGKGIGAGGGSCLLLVVPPDHRWKVEEGLKEHGCLIVPFKFDHDGSRVIYQSR